MTSLTLTGVDSRSDAYSVGCQHRHEFECATSWLRRSVEDREHSVAGLLDRPTGEHRDVAFDNLVVDKLLLRDAAIKW